MRYRVYLLNQWNKIAAAESFAAADDDEALAMGRDLYVMSSDVFCGYEVWRGKTRLVAGSPSPPANPVSIDLWPAVRQMRMLDLEERLQQSFVCIRESRTLMTAVDQLLERRS